ncbi:hypothetical protein M5D96_004824 [Drosophila gunungcola]|uniref:Uncharacterized protein n=1 Tax=Drosophila gunungcola TaxID=103775 RepID=A0A9Q0BT03_9MUSC|nr:hypothetical protein M5D96_004824 [Drosophila gunungcola]
MYNFAGDGEVTKPECESGVPGSTHAKISPSQPDAERSLHI